jgi:hypothetical protein
MASSQLFLSLAFLAPGMSGIGARGHADVVLRTPPLIGTDLAASDSGADCSLLSVAAPTFLSPTSFASYRMATLGPPFKRLLASCFPSLSQLPKQTLKYPRPLHQSQRTFGSGSSQQQQSSPQS